MDYLPHPVVSSLAFLSFFFLFWRLDIFTYYVINCFISITTLPTISFPLHIITLLFWEFFTHTFADEWQQVSKTILNILVDLNNAVVCMVSIRPYFQVFHLKMVSLSHSYSVDLFDFFFLSLAKFKYLSRFRLPLFLLCGLLVGQTLLFYSVWLSLELVVWPRFGDLLVSENLILHCRYSAVLISLIHYLILLFYSLRVSHINVSRWSFTRVWVTASLQVSRTLLSILADLHNAIVCMVSTRPVIFKS